MSIYLHDIPLPEAWKRFEEALNEAGCWGILGVEEIQLDENAVGRVLAGPIWAKLSSPHYHAAAMDGFAVRSKETEGAIPTDPRIFRVGTQATYVDTGDPISDRADAVIPIENVEPLDESGNPTNNVRNPTAIRIRAGVPPWSHIRPMGEDIVATQLILPAGQVLRSVDLGAIAAGGHAYIRVTKQPRVAILPTGSELVPIGRRVESGEIIEYNSLVLASQIIGWGGKATRYPIIPDDFEAIFKQVEAAALEHDLILLNAGSSAGSEDFSAEIVETLGDLYVHGVAVRPGHPVILGMIRSGDKQQPQGVKPRLDVPIIGVPGYPVSAALTGEIFVEPLLARWLGRRPAEFPTVSATITRKITSPAGDDDYVRVAVGRVGDRTLAAPLARGAGVITSLVRADGLVVLPRGSQGVPAGAEVEVRLYCTKAEIDRTIFVIGSHDIAVDLLAQHLSVYDRKLASANVGSLGGLLALRRKEAHFAGSHLLDPHTGEYNLSYIREYLPGYPVVVMALLERKQGLLVRKGNPKGLKSLDDLSRPDVIFINRQRGAGTRVLLDYHLEQMGIPFQTIRGYDREEYTHLAVAAAIASERADCGLGIAAAAQALDIDFLPLYEERYDLVIPREYYHSELLAPLFEIIRQEEFRKTVAGLPGYDVGIMGNIIAE